MSKFDFRRPKNCKLLNQIKGNAINDHNVFKINNFCWGGHCNCSSRASENLTAPLLLAVIFHIYAARNHVPEEKQILVLPSNGNYERSHKALRLWFKCSKYGAKGSQKQQITAPGL
jgi:hypothetical protein